MTEDPRSGGTPDYKDYERLRTAANAMAEALLAIYTVASRGDGDPWWMRQRAYRALGSYFTTETSETLP